MLVRSMGRGRGSPLSEVKGVGIGLTTLSVKIPVTETLTTTSRQQDLGEEGPVDQGTMPTPLLTPERNPQGKRRRGRPKNSWRRDTDTELRMMGYTWKEVVRKAQVRVRWRAVVNGLCSTWSDGPK